MGEKSVTTATLPEVQSEAHLGGEHVELRAALAALQQTWPWSLEAPAPLCQSLALREEAPVAGQHLSVDQDAERGADAAAAQRLGDERVAVRDATGACVEVRPVALPTAAAAALPGRAATGEVRPVALPTAAAAARPGRAATGEPATTVAGGVEVLVAADTCPAADATADWR